MDGTKRSASNTPIRCRSVRNSRDDDSKRTKDSSSGSDDGHTFAVRPDVGVSKTGCTDVSRHAINSEDNGRRLDAALKKVITRHFRTKHEVSCGEIRDSTAMALRILRKLDMLGVRLSDGEDGLVIDTFVALFIALKAECVYSPLTRDRLSVFTRVEWAALETREAQVLEAVSWRLYEGVIRDWDPPTTKIN